MITELRCLERPIVKQIHIIIIQFNMNVFTYIVLREIQF